MRKAIQFKTKGMYRDFSASSFNPDYSYENKNLRIYSTDEPNTYTMMNEKGNKVINLKGNPKIEGTPLGYSVLNNTLVLFTYGNNKDKECTVGGSEREISDINAQEQTISDILVSGFDDYIYKIDYEGNNEFSNTLLFSGDLNLSLEHPIETLANYENELNQKIYWTDAYNTIRVLNLKAANIDSWTSQSFNFVPSVPFGEEIEVTKTYSGGYFNAGVIQYAFTYYNLYGSESNIFYTTPLYYISFSDRGANPETTVGNSFNISIENSALKFDYIRIYSIYRGSLDAVPEVKRIIDLHTSPGKLTYIDNGTKGEIIDPTTLLYIGGESIIAGTLAQKDNTLFLGDIKVERRNIQNLIGEDIKADLKDHPIQFTTDEKAWVPPAPLTLYPYKNQLGENSAKIKTFKYLEWYRFGLQAQYNTGKWSDPVWIDDKQNEVHIDTTFYDGSKVKLPTAYMSLSDTVINKLLGAGYKRVRPVIVYPTITDREVICQGVLCPTVYNVGDRIDNSPFAQSSWFFRPNAPFDYNQSLYNPATGVNKPSTIFIIRAYGISSLEEVEGNIYRIENDSNDNNFYVVTGVFRTGSIEDAGFDDEGKLEVITYEWVDLEVVNYNISTPFPPKTYQKEDNRVDDLPQTIYIGNIFNNDTSVKEFHYSREPIVLFDVPWASIYSAYNSYAGIMNDFNIYSDQKYRDAYLLGLTDRGAGLEFRHNNAIPENICRNAEIQFINNPPQLAYTTLSSTEYENNYSHNFYIDQSIITLHSPDVEFDDRVKDLDMSNAKLRIVGMVPITAFTSDIDIQTKTPVLTFKDSADSPLGFYHKNLEVKCNFNNNNSVSEGSTEVNSWWGWKALASGPFWFDEKYQRRSSNNIDTEDDDIKNHFTTGFVVYPWHRNGSLNNTTTVDNLEAKSSELDKKKMSNLRVSYKTQYLPPSKIWNAYEENNNNKTGISGAFLFDSSEITLLRLPAPVNSKLTDISYYGNIDKLYPIARGSGGTTQEGYPIITSGEIILAGRPESDHNPDHLYGNAEDLFASNYEKIKDIDSDGNFNILSTDPVRIKYKSTPHLVMALNYTASGAQHILPTIYNEGGFMEDYMLDRHIVNGTGVDPSQVGNQLFFWSTEDAGSVTQEVLDIADEIHGQVSGIKSIQHGWLWLGELYKDVPEDSRFGGKSDEAIENNQWLPCGEPVDLIIGNTELHWTEGDTYYQRYDHLKTYPYTLEDQNSVVEILSFMCETHVNLDGRYDRNRGQTNNLTMTPENFNQMNDVYNQQNNFFNYRAVNPNDSELNTYPNTITWTKTKVNGEETDSWTNITLASTLDLDGNLGKVNAIRRKDNQLYVFQDNGIALVLYNERTPIAPMEGVPIEISNSGKVEGKTYLSTMAGCQNKWSICEASTGLYFVDDINKATWTIGSKGLTNLSDTLGFHSWINKVSDKVAVWNPKDFNGIITHYDKLNGDVFFVTKNECLAYSEPISIFSSFYSYENTPFILTLSDKSISINTSRATEDGEYKLWLQNEGNYNYFFGKPESYYTTLVANPNIEKDKIFDVVEFRGDVFSSTGAYKSDYQPFSDIEVWNEYQNGQAKLTNVDGSPSTLKKKFRVWRTPVPRSSGNKMDRMRNPWLYIKLSWNPDSHIWGDNINVKAVIHDVLVQYFE